MDNFDLACKELKQHGKGYVMNYDEIEDKGNYIFHPIHNLNNSKTPFLAIFYNQ